MTEATSIETLFKEICKFPQVYQKSKTAIKTHEGVAKDVIKNLDAFSNQIFDLITEETKKGITIQISRGMTFMPHILWVAFLPEGYTVSKHISAAICFGKNGEGAVAGLMESRGNLYQSIKTTSRTKHSILVDVDGVKVTKKYNNAFVNPNEFLKICFESPMLVAHMEDSIKLLKEYTNQ